ncbi:MAG TPA: hypothetical protein PK014_13080 [Thermoanaerobaculia bacterium]|nr:hypothetical protein [Thermoanaerobaculia bacterium]HUM31033.1 hypothetical protein [Thermoanaerobaculia bacterium]HXK69331.1 hypothetical protein [Thermoanaerobaculia bacterium]
MGTTLLKNSSQTNNFSPPNTLAESTFAQISYSITGTTDIQNCVRIELRNPGYIFEVLKDYGDPDTNPYDVTSLYSGIGTYSLRVTEKNNCGGTLSSVSLSEIEMYVENITDNCDLWGSSCGSLPAECSPGFIQNDALLWSIGTSDTLVWAPAGAASSYRIYRGVRDDLPKLLTTEVDSCLRYEGSELWLEGLSENPSDQSEPFYWYLVTGLNDLGEGPAGTSYLGARIMNYSTNCP